MTRCVAVASDFLAAAELATVICEYAPALSSAGVSLVAEDSARPATDSWKSDGADPIVLFIVTGGTERRVMELVGARAEACCGENEMAAERQSAIVLVAYPGRNSLPASLEVLARLQQDGVSGRIVFFDGPEDGEGIARLREAVSKPLRGDDAAAGGVPGTEAGGCRGKPPGRPLAGRRIGLIGSPSDWLVASSPDPALVRDVWGAEVVRIPLEELVGKMDVSSDARSARGGSSAESPATVSTEPSISAFADSFAGTASECREPTAADLESSGRIYAALRLLVAEHALDALTVRCFDLVTDLGATGCLALSRLTDEGVIAGCEGDLVSAIGLLWAREVTGETPWMANPARVDVAKNSLTLAHCTVPCSIVDSFALRSHFESGLGAAVAGVIPAGPVTLLRIGGMGLDRLWVAHGEITSAGNDERMCRTQVDVRLPGDSVAGAHVADILGRPLGNHIVLVRGFRPSRDFS